MAITAPSQDCRRSFPTQFRKVSTARMVKPCRIPALAAPTSPQLTAVAASRALWATTVVLLQCTKLSVHPEHSALPALSTLSAALAASTVSMINLCLSLAQKASTAHHSRLQRPLARTARTALHEPRFRSFVPMASSPFGRLLSAGISNLAVGAASQARTPLTHCIATTALPATSALETLRPPLRRT